MALTGAGSRVGLAGRVRQNNEFGGGGQRGNERVPGQLPIRPRIARLAAGVANGQAALPGGGGGGRAPTTPVPRAGRRPRRAARGPSSDPGCPSARVASSEVEVAMYAASGNGFGGLQERAWDFILANAAAIEAALRRKLFAWHGKRMAQFRDEDLPHVKPLQKYWKEIERQGPVEQPAAIDHLFKLVGIGLADSGLDECGVSSFQFQTGWDPDH